ncbi:MAG: response regulator, partial [Nitrososphaeraceae archaeon]
NSNEKDISQHHRDHSNNPRKILIVDDEPDITSTFDMILQMNGFEVDSYNDPLLALSNFKPNSYGLALLDIRMPKMNGFELYKVIRKLDKGIIVCFWTAFEVCYEELRKMFPAMDERYFIRKPIAMDELIDRIQSIISPSAEMTNAITPNNSATNIQEK